ncbi:NmrA family NAD(P)-binding protein [Fibrella forsythiae]|uniref:NmrA family NAD(P)-binding protein n=1 Tax=Fibrella forsythiae TaxID=2817061 RepID=A0ABS3JRF5_9BACT|nr:NmrA family NAD(P)-binding protein [Fibrella forsythiae]MBO0951961.1 NmrA family NAD(P)-binding protein [Fibrella forsythiae]
MILLAGATGDLGGRIVKALLAKGADVRAVVRTSSDPDKVKALEQLGVTVFRVDMNNLAEVTTACKGVSCVVSVLAGFRDTIIGTQNVLLDAAVAAGVPRFIPSDYSLDFTRFSDGENRNLDLRRDFHTYLAKAPIKATTIFNGAFAELITGAMPLILFKPKLVLYWGDADHRMGFTTMDNTAEFTANAALDSTTPRYLYIAGDQISPRQIKDVVSNLTGDKYRLFRAGSPIVLSGLIKVAQTVAPGEGELYPAWQGMQYMRNMIDKRARLDGLDNDRYPSIRWTTIKDVLTAHQKNL